ncbi:aminopeptidase N-like [Temnothorax nylanderi]|uniref:aminopeptidase N-like n=1 Tax=Temnothorax nylanderi TaxID=102681 RepID=UPI003A889CA7
MRQVDIARLIGHAVAYQCLSSHIGPSSWSYMWLNQGISMLLAMDTIQQILPYPIKDLFVVQTLQESLRLDVDSIMNPLVSEVNGPSDNDSGFYFAYYLKAPAILRMLQQILGEKVFQNGVNKYLSNDPSYSGKTNIEAFWTAMQAAHEEHKYDVEHFNVKERIEAWTTREHYPVIKVTQNETFITVTTESTNTSEKKWWIPYSANVIDDLYFPLSLQPISYILSGEGQITYKNEKHKFTIANLKQIGK